jgi:hypothetical protein
MATAKYLLLFLGLILIVGIVEAGGTKAAKVSNNIYQIPKTNVAPVIDGLLDQVWKTVDWNFQRLYTVDGTPADSGTGLTGMSKAMWDDQNLYILFYNQDDVICDNPAQTAGWQKDAVEIYIDADNSKIPDGVAPDPGGGLAPGDIQLTIPHAFMGTEAANLANIGFPAAIPTTGVEFAIIEDDNVLSLGGWWLEMKIPLDNIDLPAVAGTEIGWELQQDESDDNSARQSMSKWWSPSNNSWTDASIWGTAVLSDRVVDTVLEIRKVPSGVSITIDGLMDDIYKQANPASMNLYRVDNAGNISNVMFDAFITTYALWDDANLYVFFDVIDDDIQDNPAQTAGWQKDAVEFYLDPDNSKIPDGVPPDPGGGLAPGDIQLTIPHAFMGVEAANLANIGFPAAISTAGVEFKITEKNEGGWYLELKIPLDNIDLPAVEGTQLGFEIQQDESDADDSGARGAMEKWWNASNNSWTNASIWGTAYLGPAIVTGVEPKNPSVVSTYKLEQNYPNPFNPSTKITYSIAKTERVKLAVYNILGTKVAELVNGTEGAGTHTVNFSAQNLSSGVYFYKLETGNTMLMKKMMLLK